MLMNYMSCVISICLNCSNKMFNIISPDSVSYADATWTLSGVCPMRNNDLMREMLYIQTLVTARVALKNKHCSRELNATSSLIFQIQFTSLSGLQTHAIWRMQLLKWHIKYFSYNGEVHMIYNGIMTETAPAAQERIYFN